MISAAIKDAMGTIEHVFPDSEVCGESGLWFAVLYLAVLDIRDYEKGFRGQHAVCAYHYLVGQEDIYAAEICGVDSGYIRRILRRARII